MAIDDAEIYTFIGDINARMLGVERSIEKLGERVGVCEGRISAHLESRGNPNGWRAKIVPAGYAGGGGLVVIVLDWLVKHWAK